MRCRVNGGVFDLKVSLLSLLSCTGGLLQRPRSFSPGTESITVSGLNPFDTLRLNSMIGSTIAFLTRGVAEVRWCATMMLFRNEQEFPRR